MEPYRHNEGRRLTGLSRFIVAFLLTALLLYALFLVEAPFYIYKPGTAENVRPMVRIERQAGEDRGSFLLTTVSMSHSNLFNLLTAMFNPLYEIRPKEAVLRGRTEEEYTRGQDYIMLTSQSNAIQAAYNKADIPYRIESEGLMILETISGMAAHGLLLPGDRIEQVDELAIRAFEQLNGYLQTKKPGDTVTVTYSRNGATGEQPIVLDELPSGTGEHAGEPKPGLGIRAAELLYVKAGDAERQVTIDAGEIGGPSAGLMFSLEIYNQLVEEDISKGYKIAGTGTISPDGNVCPIGGIQHKVVAADREGAEIFFAPKDATPPACGLTSAVSNATDARNQAQRIGSAMKVVPVATLDEAIQYLQSLAPKSS